MRLVPLARAQRRREPGFGPERAARRGPSSAFAIVSAVAAGARSGVLRTVELGREPVAGGRAHDTPSLHARRCIIEGLRPSPRRASSSAPAAGRPVRVGSLGNVISSTGSSSYAFIS